MSMSMRERIAQALLETTCRHFGDPIPKNPDHTLNLVLADAVLAELEKPTNGMLEAANVHGGYIGKAKFSISFTAAIRAAKEGK